MSSYFYLQADKNPSNATFLNQLERYADNNKRLIYVLNRPLTDQKYHYKYSQSLIILSPKNKIAIIDYGDKEDEFEYYVEDVIEDIGSIADKYLYKDVIGRPRQWRRSLLNYETKIEELTNVELFFKTLSLPDEAEIKKVDLLISLFIGSINDIDRVKDEVPVTALDKVKQKIQLFDGDQTRFIYQNPDKKNIRIQGLSGTGKTELLLHKLKDLYTTDFSSKIYFTCHNKILADSLHKRIPSFFNFMKVEQQIEWEERLWCTNAWGSSSDVNSGAYRYICAFYQIPFFRYSYQMSFSRACKLAKDEIKSKYSDQVIPFAFSYMFIDESQDFDENFFELCELVTEKNIYIAGDIFQSIFDETISSFIAPDFLLGKCYRTDPKTLMFAHALGMGLFEDNKLRWLEKPEWEDCGYTVEIVNHKYQLSREPLRRFEDLEDDFESIKIEEVSNNYSDTIVKIIKKIYQDNNTLLPEDIGIILLDQDNDIYKLADILEIKIRQTFGWMVNKAYETKEKLTNSVFVSNRNNVKGLEFPFVICVTKKIRNGSSYRNSLYTMLTRSFITSYLVIPDNNTSGLTDSMKKGLKEIIKNKQMVIEEPTEAEKKKIRTRFEHRLKRLSHYDIMMGIFKKLEVDKIYHEKLFQATQQFDMIESDEETLKEFVESNLRFIKER
jgi:superfamily I DNA and RNA helicase